MAEGNTDEFPVSIEHVEQNVGPIITADVKSNPPSPCLSIDKDADFSTTNQHTALHVSLEDDAKQTVDYNNPTNSMAEEHGQEWLDIDHIESFDREVNLHENPTVQREESVNHEWTKKVWNWSLFYLNCLMVPSMAGGSPNSNDGITVKTENVRDGAVQIVVDRDSFASQAKSQSLGGDKTSAKLHTVPEDADTHPDVYEEKTNSQMNQNSAVRYNTNGTDARENISGATSLVKQQNPASSGANSSAASLYKTDAPPLTLHRSKPDYQLSHCQVGSSTRSAVYTMHRSKRMSGKRSIQSYITKPETSTAGASTENPNQESFDFLDLFEGFADYICVKDSEQFLRTSLDDIANIKGYDPNSIDKAKRIILLSEVVLDLKHAVRDNKRLGAGSFGQVWKYRIHHHDHTFEFACKQIQLSKFRKKEVEILFENKGQCFPYLYGIIQKGCTVFILMEFIPNTLYFIGNNARDMLTEKFLRKILFQSVNILEELKKKGYVHRDIKPEHIGIDKYGNVKILDLGSVWEINDRSEDCKAGGTTVQYMSPEQCGPGDDRNCDMYAIALSLLHTVTGSMQCDIFTRNKSVRRCIQQEISEGKNHPKVLNLIVEALNGKDSCVTPILADLLCRMVALRSEDRIKPEEAIRNKMFDEFRPEPIGPETVIIPNLGNYIAVPETWMRENDEEKRTLKKTNRQLELQLDVANKQLSLHEMSKESGYNTMSDQQPEEPTADVEKLIMMFEAKV